MQAIGPRSFQSKFGGVFKEHGYECPTTPSVSRPGKREEQGSTKTRRASVTERSDLSLASTVKWINAAREKRRQNIRDNLLLTKMTGDVASVIVGYLPTSSYPPKLYSEIRADGSDDANEKTKTEVRNLIKGSALDSSTYHITSVRGNMRHLHAAFRGPENTSSSAILFQVEIFLPHDYPDSAPSVRYLTAVEHKDVDDDGTPDLSLLMGRWCDTYNIALLLMALRAQLLHAFCQSALKDSPCLQLQRRPMHHAHEDNAALATDTQRFISPLYKLPLRPSEDIIAALNK
eukprot:CAMPEP_0167793922 /NCGR_PEP_ID=MMETSP0111_2-20121227/13503_1 /TAXON_ID=91324 /ORGANISM="Lotharella globosa, Strain CCCM811" /LENGTH=288 /DNA_ID=CAMNT_0007687241 /DNA_START=111 /DNA_END=977 /DNA_ORIENTATION=+